MKSAFLKWEEPPPAIKHSNRIRKYDATLTVFDLISSTGRWALTEWPNAGSGLQFVEWCKARGMKAESIWRQGKVYVRLLP